MHSKVMDGKTLASLLEPNLKQKVELLKERHGIVPTLAVLSAGDEAGKVYIRSKQRACERLGIEFQHYDMSHKCFSETLSYITILNNDPNVNGIIIQSPFGNFADEQYRQLVDRVDPMKDVDGLCQHSVGNLWMSAIPFDKDYFFFMPCTPLGIMRLLHHYLGDLSSMNAVILGRSDLVGKPLANMLLNADCTVTVCHSQTEKLMQHVGNADILVTAMGEPGIITEIPYGRKALVDVSINRDENGRLVGDIPKHLYNRFEYHTPVPGGVGPMTVAMLMHNVVDACYRQNKFLFDA